MTRQRWFYGGGTLLLLGLLCASFSLVAAPTPREPQFWLTLASGLCCLLATGPLWVISRSASDALPDWVQEQQAFRESMQEASRQLERQADLLQKRERELADRFLQYQSWMEYPLDESLNSDDDASAASSPTEVPFVEESLEQLEQRQTQDRELASLLEREAERLFNKVKENAYSEQGQFQVQRLRDDLTELLTKVARIYHPDAEQPLLETSIEQLLRAFSRTSLHLLVLLERLPINVAEYNVQSLYNYVRQGLRVYQAYQSVRPFMPYVNYATYAGRFVLGANPLALGAQWALWKLGSEGATAAVKHLVNRQALAFLHDSIVVVGYEMASLYGGDIRHRNKYWIFGVELSELLSRFPVARESLLQAFAEIGRLPFPSEYDRVFLYRCIAAHRAGGAKRFRPQQNLSLEDRRWIAQQLGKFAQRHLAFRDETRLTKWHTEVQTRLAVAVPRPREASQDKSQAQQHEAAAIALLQFLIAERQVDWEELATWRQFSQLLGQLPAERWQTLLAELSEESTAIFELPDLDPASPLVNRFLEELAEATAHTTWQQGADWGTLEWVGEFFRVDSKRQQQAIDQALHRELQRRFVSDRQLPKLTRTQIVGLLELAPPEQTIELIYNSVRIEGLTEATHNPLLVAWAERLVLLDVNGAMRLLWTNEEPVSTSFDQRLLTYTCSLSGGKWLLDKTPDAIIRLQYSFPRGGQSYFAPLESFLAKSG